MVIAEPVSADPEDRLLSKVNIFPNPANDYLTIESLDKGLTLIEINSINGRKIYSGKMEGGSQQIDLSSFEKGVYFITIQSEGFVRTEKFIKL